MRPRAPRSTLFPYTTLFRSGALRAARRGRATGGGGAAGRPAVCVVLPELHVLGARDRTTQDRKSTRLNSSHRCISYAVFCLKKKRRCVAAVSIGVQGVRARY